MSEHVTIERGQWWFSNDNQTRCYICGFDPDGDPVFLMEPKLRPDTDRMVDFVACWHHEPRCTGWDWQPEPEPEWFDLTPLDGHVLRKDVDWFLNCFDEWSQIYSSAGMTINEYCIDNGKTQFRCLLKDAPIPEPKPATQTIVFHEVIRRIAMCNEKKEEVITWTSYPMDSDFRTGETREVVR